MFIIYFVAFMVFENPRNFRLGRTNKMFGFTFPKQQYRCVRYFTANGDFRFV